MDCKIISRLFLLIIIFTTTQLNAIEFKGKFLQGHYIIGITDPAAKIIVGKKEVRVSNDGYFVFGIDRDRKFDLIITKIKNGKKEKIKIIRPHLIKDFVESYYRRLNKSGPLTVSSTAYELKM